MLLRPNVSRPLHRVARVALVATLFLSACASVDPPVVPDDAVDLTSESAVTVSITDNKYTERTIAITEGTEVTWVNDGRNNHNVISSDGQFDTISVETLGNGGSDSKTLGVGAYPYYCSIHGTANRGQRGWIYVVPK